jgi:hypothetical protein
MNILLDYFFPITAISPTPQASTAFLKQACVVVKPATDVPTGAISLCTSMAQVEALTDNEEAQQLFDAGMNRVYVLPMSTLDLDAALEGHESDFFTLLISSDFTKTDVTGADFGAFKGVIGVSSEDDTFLATQAAIENRAAFHTTTTNKAKNMFYAFGKMLSNSLNWLNQQYITMPVADDVDTLGEANALFDDKISFVIDDSEFGKRLGLFTAGGKAIVAPYITRNLEIDMQSKALSYISGNQPGYTRTHAALLEDELQKVIASYIDRQWIERGVVEVKLEQENFVASGYINISEPKALWRIFGEIRQTL